jgi:hypothetical protein
MKTEDGYVAVLFNTYREETHWISLNTKNVFINRSKHQTYASEMTHALRNYEDNYEALTEQLVNETDCNCNINCKASINLEHGCLQNERSPFPLNNRPWFLLVIARMSHPKIIRHRQTVPLFAFH